MVPSSARGRTPAPTFFRVSVSLAKGDAFPNVSTLSMESHGPEPVALETPPVIIPAPRRAAHDPRWRAQPAIDAGPREPEHVTRSTPSADVTTSA